MRRVLLLAYLIIWAWREHELLSAQQRREPLRRFLIIVDELEAHLHPKWQRIVLPALLSVSELLSADIAVQMVAATHSPMVMASLESIFTPDEDVLYHLAAEPNGVRLDEVDFVKYGDASAWLTSPLFGLRQARSREAEKAIDAAKSLQLAEDVPVSSVREINDQLKRTLGPEDLFWPRWVFFAESHGVAV